MAWYYKEGDQQIGPVTKSELQALIKTKRIDGKTLVRGENDDRWRPLIDLVKSKPKPVQTSAPAEPSPPPPPSSPVPPDKEDFKQAEPRPPAGMAKQVPFEFKGTGGEYFKIWIVNVVLSILTFGIYSAWAKVRRKQYFYGNTSVTGDAFRYLADPVKILKGRLIVFAFFVISSIVNNIFPPFSLVMSIVLFIVVPFLVVRSLMFNARNSSWRNIRFNFTGSYGSAAIAFILWPILSAVTLGILVPYAFYKQKKFIVENSAYGTTRFSFNATAKDYYAIVLRFVVPVIVLVVAVSLASYFLSGYMPDILRALSPLMAMGIIALYFFVFIYFGVKFSNLLYNSGALSGHRFRATMLVPQYAWIVISNTVATVLTVGLFYPFARVRAFRYKIQHLELLPSGDLDKFVAAELKETSAFGDEMSDFLDFDFGL